MSDIIRKTGASPVEQGGAHNGDDAWIEKYRDALQKAPVKKIRFESLRKKIEGLRKALFAYLGKISQQSVAKSRRGHKLASSTPITVETPKKTAGEPLQPHVKKSGQRKAG